MRARSTPLWPTRVSAGPLLGLALAFGSPASGAEAPPDVAALTAAAEQDLLVVTVSYNGVPREGLAYVLREGDALLVDTETLRRLKIRFDSSIATVRENRVLVPAAAMVGLSWNLDAKRQHLDLMTDPRTMAQNDITYQFSSVPQPELPNWGGYLNYALFGTSSLDGGDHANVADTLGAALTASVFGPYGVGTAGFLVNSRSSAETPQSVVLLDANWRWDDVAHQTTLLVGDAVSTPGWWGQALRFGGVQFGTNFALQPGFVTYPLMAASGLATVPSTADILINNVRVAEQAVPAGPFTISNLPTMTGAGELNLVVRDAFGQQQVVSQPFYIAQQLLKPGLTEFSVGAGAARLDYGLKNLDYGGSFGYGWMRHGFGTNHHGRAARRGGHGRCRSRRRRRCAARKSRCRQRRDRGQRGAERCRHALPDRLRPPDAVPLLRGALHACERALPRTRQLRHTDLAVVDCVPAHVVRSIRLHRLRLHRTTLLQRRAVDDLLGELLDQRRPRLSYADGRADPSADRTRRRRWH